MSPRWRRVLCTLIIALPCHPAMSAIGGGPAGGNVRTLAVDPSNPNIIYAGSFVCCGLAATTFEQTLKGGIFKTTNGGQSWIAMSNGLPDAPVTSLSVDPNNPNTVYAATFTNGVFKTADGGQSWNAVNAGLTNLAANGVVVDPNNSSIVYAETQSTGGFFKSTNGGQSWASVNLGFTFDQVTSLAFDLTNPSTMYIGASGATSDGSTGFFKTTDGGQSWILANAGLIQPPLGGGIGVSAIAIDPTNPAILYVAGGSVFKSSDGGQSWTLVAPRLGVSSILVDPSQPTTLYAAGGSGFFKSTDGGASWIALNTGLTDTDVQALVMSPGVPSTLYAATASDGVFKTADGGQLWASATAGINARIVGALAVDPSNSATLYAGSGPSLFKTTDSGTTWIPLSAIDPGQKSRFQVGFLSLAVDPSASSTVYAGGYICLCTTQASSGVLKSTDGGQSWAAAVTSPFPSNVLSLAIDPTAPSTVYATSGSLGVDKSTDGGQSWIESIFPGFGKAVTAIVVDPNDATIVYAAASGPGGGLFKSTDGALTWTSVLNDSLWSLVALPTLPGTTLYAGSLTGTVYKSTDGGATWSALLSGLSDSQGNIVSVRTLAVPASTPTTIYAGTFGAGIFNSTDGGQTWNAINAGLPNLAILRLVVDPASPATIYAATSGAGVFKSTNGGQSWQGTEPPAGTGTPGISVSPNQITFPPTLLNTRSNPVTVTASNPGLATLLISDISTQSPFAIVNFSSNITTGILPNTSGSFDVIFSPSAVGSYSGTVTITSNAPSSPTTISLQGSGAVPTATLSATTITFPTQLVGMIGPQRSVTLANNSVVPLTINGASVIGDFSLKPTASSCPYSGGKVAPGDSCTIDLAFQAPTLTGSRVGKVTITDNAANSPQSVSLSGIALALRRQSLLLFWPLANDDNRSHLTQSYSEFNLVVPGKYHTGVDITASSSSGTAATAAAAGSVAEVQLNGGNLDTAHNCKPPTQPGQSSFCADHGYGNTIILRHALPNGSTVFTQYSHLTSLDTQLLRTVQHLCGALARIIHIFEDNKSLLCYKHVD